MSVEVVDRLVAFRASAEARLAGAIADASAFSAPAPLLDRFELEANARSFAWACIVAAIDPMMYPHVIAVGGADGRRGLTPAAFAALTATPERDAIALAQWLAGDPPIVRFGLLERDNSELLPIATPYRASPRLIAHAIGDRAHRLDRTVTPPSAPRHDEAQRAAVAAIARALAAGRVVVVEGRVGVGRRTAVAGCVAPRRTIAIDASRIGLGELDRAVRDACAEAMLLDAIPVIADLDRVPAREHDGIMVAPLVARIADELPGPIAITTSGPGFELPTSRTVERVVLPQPDVATRLALWVDAVGNASGLRDIALRHQLGAGQIADAARVAKTIADAAPIEIAHVVDGIRGTIADRFGSLVERLTVSDTWDDMVLSPETKDQLSALVARVHHAWTVYEEWRFPHQTARGGGVAALFSGPPGTGKTMVAGLIARELGRDLYRIDLSQVMSKWVGETEKQLGRIFDAAESGNALLLFDEADSLFAKRTEVKSSSDRYANLEVNYLLQRIETFSGMTILTTNLDTSIDPALRRRLAAHVVFWPPEHDERIELWRRFLATGAPVDDDIDFEDLAGEYPDMTGANIRNATLAAAFLAARERGTLSADRLHRAARAEYRAMGRILAGKR